MINNSRVDSRKSSLSNYVRAVEYAVERYSTKAGVEVPTGTFTITEGGKAIEKGSITIPVDYKGEEFSGKIFISGNGDIKLNNVQLNNSKEVYSYEEKTGTEQSKNKMIDYVVNDEGTVIKLNEELITFDKDDYLVIPAENNVGDKITGITNAAFSKTNMEVYTDYETGEDYIVIYDGKNFDKLKVYAEEYSQENYEEIIPIYLVGEKMVSADDELVDYAFFDVNTGEYLSLAFKGWVNKITKISFEEATNITAIPMMAFYGISYDTVQLDGIKLGSTITTIGQSAFNGVHYFTSLIIPENVVTIYPDAFSSYSKYTVTVLGDSTRFDSNWNFIFYNGTKG